MVAPAEQLLIAAPAAVACFLAGYVAAMARFAPRRSPAVALALTELFRGKGPMDNRSVWARARRRAALIAKWKLRQVGRARVREYYRAKYANGTYRL